jgi:hypothetical protein
VSPADRLKAAGFTEEPLPTRVKIDAELCEHQPQDLTERGYVRCRIRMDYGGVQYVHVPKGKITAA